MDGTTFIKRNEPRHELQLEDGILSRDGWTLIDDSSGLLFDNSDFSWVKERENRTVQDWYFMAYGSDYKAALKDFTLLPEKYHCLLVSYSGIGGRVIGHIPTMR